MNKEKISSQEIIDLIASKASVSKRAAEEFLKVMIATIEDALLANDAVKIKGFGTFKLLWNEPRKSVNVQSGEEIVLDGYYKVAFTPENSLKELVNEPFEHLEAVQLDADDNFIIPDSKEEEVLDPLRVFEEQASEIKNLLSEIQALSTSSKKTQIEAERVEISDYFAIEQNAAIEIVPVQEETIEEIEVAEEIQLDLLVEEEIEKAKPEEAISNDNEIEPEIQSELETEPEILVYQEPVIVEDMIVVDNEITLVESDPLIVNEEDKAEFESTPFLIGLKPARKRKKWLLISIIVLVVVSATVGLFLFNTPTKRFGNLVLTKCKTEMTYLKENMSVTDMINTVSKWFAPKPQKVTPVETVVIPKDTDAVDSVELKEPIDTLQGLFDNPRIYNDFIGSEQIKPGSRLTIMSLHYYGSKDFWVYIYEANKERINNPDDIETGTLIRIPRLDKRLIDIKNPRCIQKAKELHDLYVKNKS